MAATLASAGITYVGALALGQLLLRLCGVRTWSWLSAPVGVAALMLVTVPALHVPGRSATCAVAALVLALAGVVLWLREPASRPQAGGLLAVVPAALLSLVPFVASGRFGTLGVSFDNDMSSHLLWAEAYRSSAVAAVTGLPTGYPLGPHALVAALAQGLGVRVDQAFAGLTIAGPALIATTSLVALNTTTWLRRAAFATVAGMAYLLAAYMGQGSFKEMLEALFVLGSVLELRRQSGVAEGGVRRWIPLALIVAGSMSVYSFEGILWPAAFLGVWVVVTLGEGLWRRSLRPVMPRLVPLAVPVIVGLAVLALVLVPQFQRLHQFFAASAPVGGGGTGTGTAIAKNDIGNLAGPLPFWEGFGIWSIGDYRFTPPQAFNAGLWSAFAAGAAVFGLGWSLRRRDWMLPLATVVSLGIWEYAQRTQSPYVAAKALVIVSPMLLMLAMRPLVEQDRLTLALPSWWRSLRPLLAALLLVAALGSSWETLRFSFVGPTTHLDELRSLQPAIGRHRVLFLGNDDFIKWELAGTPVDAPIIGFPVLPMRPEKAWAYGQPIDFDSVDATTINAYDYVITTRDAAGSAPPRGLRRVAGTRDFVLWRRTGKVTPRALLAEGPNAAAVLNCRTKAGRRLLRRGGVAAVRGATLGAAAPNLLPGQSAAVSIKLGKGTWDLETPYISPRPVQVRGAGIATTLPANLDRPGPRWPIGRVVLRRAQTVTLTFRATKTALTPATAVAQVVSLLATRAGSERVVPLRQACGKLVDWYRR